MMMMMLGVFDCASGCSTAYDVDIGDDEVDGFRRIFTIKILINSSNLIGCLVGRVGRPSGIGELSVLG